MELRYAVRQLIRNPRYTAIAALTLALGIAGVSVVFAAVNALVFQPMRAGSLDGLYHVTFIRWNAGSSGPLTIFVQGMGEAAKAMADLMDEFPLLKDALVNLAGIASMYKLLKIAETITGVKKLRKLLAGTAAAAGAAGAAEGAGAAAAARG